MPVNATSAWARAVEIAAQPRDPATWRQDLADAIEKVLRPDVVGVFLCTLGNMLEAVPAMAPPDQRAIGQRLVDKSLPRMHRAGLETPWDMFAASDDVPRPAIAGTIHAELLEPAGFQGLIGDFLRARDAMVAGWIAVFTHAPARERLPEIAEPLWEVCRTAEETIRRSIGIATLVGGRFPKISPSPLSDREREIARLAARGFSDLNIADRLHISEGTVGRHLHNIFRKLGVSSRLELSELLCAPD